MRVTPVQFRNHEVAEHFEQMRVLFVHAYVLLQPLLFRQPGAPAVAGILELLRRRFFLEEVVRLQFLDEMLERRWLADPQRSDGRVFSVVILQLPPDFALHAPRNFGGSLVGEKRFVERVVFDVDRDFQKLFVLHRFLAFFFRRSQSHE